MIDIKIESGINVFSNSSDATVSIDSLDMDGVVSLKTLVDGSWKSWTADAPDDFQGFTDLEKGQGFVSNADSEVNFSLDGELINVNDMNISTGLNTITLPFDARSIGDGYIPRMKISSIKTISADGWESWTVGAPDDFQGFTDTDTTKAYVCNVEEVYGTYLDTSKPDGAEGIKLDLPSMFSINEDIKSGVTYTDPNGAGTINFKEIEFDESTPTVIMFISLNDIVAKVEYPSEMNGTDLYIKDSEGTKYTVTFEENEDYDNPTIITTEISDDNIELTYDTVVVADDTTYKTMNITFGDIKTSIVFAEEYEGLDMLIWKDGSVTPTTFAEGDVTVEEE